MYTFDIKYAYKSQTTSPDAYVVAAADANIIVHSIS